LKKWMIPSNTVLAAHGWVSFDEQTGFHNPTNIGFGLSKDGEQVFLSYLPGTAADRVVDAVSFKAQENGWSLGRYPDGGAFWYALRPPTRDAANSAPLSHVIISELMYHPPDLAGTNDNALDEFIELFNPTDNAVPLYNTNGGFRLDGGVSFHFAANTVLQGSGYLLLVNFDPVTNAAQLVAFKNLYGLTDPVLTIVGPYAGKLANSSDRVALEAPLAADGVPGAVSWSIVDEVIYADHAPWPCGSDGTGNSLQRIATLPHGCDPENWIAEPPTAGRGRVAQGAGRPTIVAQPQDRIVPTNGNASFSVSVCGVPPFSYQWQFNGVDLEGATNATLVLNNVQLSRAGNYTVTVTNPGGSTTSDTATLIVQFPPFITAPPQSQAVVAYSMASFSVSAGGTAPLSYQWRFNGVPLPSATNATLVLTNVQPAQQGDYSVQVFNSAGAVLSSDAFLTVNVPATITSQPTNRIVGGGSNALFSVTAVGTAPLQYQWRFNGTALTDATNATLLITNAQLTNSGGYQAVVLNPFGTATSQVATLTVLVRPIITQQPQSLTVLQGVNATFTVAAIGTTPISFRWRKNNLTFTNALIVTTPTNSSLTITNAQPSDSATFNVAITNLAGQASGLSSNAALTVLADFDHDGLPDDWERAYGFQTNNPADALLDADFDTSSNLDEYRAGTDPTNRLSYLKIETISADFATSNVCRLTFLAVSNRTYAVQSRESLFSGIWERVADVSAAPTNRVVEVLDIPPAGASRRYYRLLIPPVAP
jgi:hypothetical protein